MKRFSNLLFYPALLTASVYAMYLWFSGEPFGAGEFVYAEDRYRATEWFFGIMLLVVALGYALNSVDRYSGLFFFSRISSDPQLMMQTQLGGQALRWSAMTFGIGIPLALLSGGFLMIADSHSFFLGLLVLFGGVEKLIYYAICRSTGRFKVALTKNAMIVYNGGLQIIPFAGCRSIDRKYDEWLFTYSDRSVKSVFAHLVSDEYSKEFYDMIEELAKEKGIPVSLRI